MAWTETTRAQYRRDGLRYASDLTDDDTARKHNPTVNTKSALTWVPRRERCAALT